MDALVAHLLRLAVAMTGYPEPALPPDVQIVSDDRMPCTCIAAMLYPSTVFGYGYSMHPPSRIILHETVDPRSTFGASVLLHELVHALQAGEGPAVPGSAQWHNREREAYAAQRRYLMRHGLAAPGRFGLGSAED